MSENKKTLRQVALAYRENLDHEKVQQISARMQALSLNVLQTSSPCTVAIYHPARGEPDLTGLVQQANLAMLDWALPVCCTMPTGKVLNFARWRHGDPLVDGLYGIPVPEHMVWLQPEIIVLPCVAFHRTGRRLGYGAGWYDRTLSNLQIKPLTIGVAYAATEAAQDFGEAHDHPVDIIITEEEIIHVTGRSVPQ
ncbi:MAG TPA: 5-formyltetrahydrofolate cyclo-ligase [Limnobacter sp.]|nr:5-formyltetrahydrofolate cyclo-ligase [Limnobacter sp.]